MSRKRKYDKTTGYYVYSHITPDGLFYIGMSQMQPSRRWQPSMYKNTALELYIQKYGWDNIRHFIFKDGLTKEQALQLEDLLIQEATDKEYCINSNRSGLIVSDKKAYEKQWYSEHKDEMKTQMKQYNKQLRATTEGKIYYRVASYNQYHPDKVIETPMEAKKKYLETGYIPNYIKNDDLM